MHWKITAMLEGSAGPNYLTLVALHATYNPEGCYDT